MARVVYNWLGSSGLKVSNVCLGTMLFGEHPKGRPACNEPEAHAILDQYAALGGNFIDTADIYQMGKSETIVGNWLAKQKREKFVVCTKVRRRFDASDVNSEGLSRKHIMWSIEESLKRLQTDYVDLYMIHVWDDGVSLEETLSALNDLVHMGKVRYLGMSNAKGWQMQKIVEVSKQRGWAPFICLQQQYNLLCRSVEWEVLGVCRKEGLGVLPWSPLKGGWLSGKIKPGMSAPVEGSRVAWAQAEAGRAIHSHPNWDMIGHNPATWNILQTLQDIGNTLDKSVAQVALRWLLQKQVVPSVVIGVRTLDQLTDCMAAATDWQLTKEQMEQLDTASAIPAPYPYDYIVADNINRQRP